MSYMLAELYIFVVYLFYGLAFYTIAVAIFAKGMHGSRMPIARHFWLFALFAFLHALNEWFDLFLLLEMTPVPPDGLYPILKSTQVALVLGSYVFLLFFGIRLLELVAPARLGQALRHLPLILFCLLVGVLVLQVWQDPPRFSYFLDRRLRNVFGLTGSLTTGFGLMLYARTVRDFSGRDARYFLYAGIFVLVYGVLTGLIPSGTYLAPYVPVELLRGICALVILHFLMLAMHVFDVERENIIEERLQRFSQSEKLHSMGKLAAGVAHEINNPLANVSLNIELLRKEVLNDDNRHQVEKRFDAIERNLDRASRIARELLYFSREKEAEMEPLDLNQVIRSTLALLGDRQDSHQLLLHLAEPLPAVEGIPWKLEEVFLNLVLNALEATPAGGSIEVTTRCRATEVLAQVADSGTGIDPAILPKIFDPFFTTKGVGQGTGLGLSICYGIMEKHGGRIEVASQPGQGTTMTLVFPVMREEDDHERIDH
jgi:two-component system, NtrC family, sensor kinase